MAGTMHNEAKSLRSREASWTALPPRRERFGIGATPAAFNFQPRCGRFDVKLFVGVVFFFTLIQFFTVGCVHHNAPTSQLLLSPAAPEMNRRAPELFGVRLDTSKGTILLEIHRDWAPQGADRFYNLVRAGFYDQARFFRVTKDRWAQFGINGEPQVARLWRTQTIPDDPRMESNVRGTIAYAFAVPNGRTTQVFINLRDNSATHDLEPFVPFGRVLRGMEVADELNAEYGESAGGGIRGGKQDPLFDQGNQYLKLNFPRLDYIKRAVFIGADASANHKLEFAAKERRERKELAGFGTLCVLCVLLRLFQLREASWTALPTRRERFWIILVPCFCGSLHLLSGAETQSGTVENGSFRVTFDEHGITGLANPKDPFRAQMLAPSQRLGLLVRFRAEDTNWLELAPNHMQLAGTNDNSELIFTNDLADGPLSLTEKFTTDGSTLDWELALQTTTNIPVEVGDLAIQVPVAGPRGEQPKDIFEHGFLRHQFISRDGSFLYYVRASGVPPFLLITVRPGTHLEYFTGGAGRGGGPVFIHSGLSGSKETRGTWRQDHTFLKLGANGAANSTVRYGFRFQWANSYDELRELLYRSGLFDIRAVPGMVVPTDLTARFALHTRAHIDSIKPEFPNETKITELGGTQPGYHLYEVVFRRLGENLLTIHHDGNRKTYLEYFATEPLETLLKKRSAFIINRQQVRDPTKWWDGVFGPYDMKHKIVRTIEDPDIFTGRMIYVLTCDDPGLCKAPFVAEKNVSFPDRNEIKGLEYYLEHFVWGHLQRTDKEEPYPYGVYGTPNWYTDRNPERRKTAAGSNQTALRDLSKEHIWRSYDYPHVVMLYYHMYEIAKKYPQLSKYLDAKGYLERAYQTAHAFFIYPYEIYPSYYETYKWGLYNELVVLKLADALDREGFPDRAAWLRSEWEKKVKYFVYDDTYPFRSEYAFDRTAFESSYAFAKYGATHDMKPDTNLWHDVKLKKWYSHPSVRRDDSRAFMERQLAAGLCVRGWLEATYYQLGADGGLSYMAAMGGWGILDYALNFAANPYDWLQLGYASYLSSWCLVNAGPPENNYGFWFPGKENDGAAGWQFMSAKHGRAWMGADVPRGPWPYDGEIDLGFGGALRMAATIVAHDPIFGWVAYGGVLSATNQGLSVIPRDGLRQRFGAIVGDAKDPKTNIRRLKLELDCDGFAVEQPIRLNESVEEIRFTVENRTSDRHITVLWLSPPAGTTYVLRRNGNPVPLQPTGNWDYPLRADLDIDTNRVTVELTKSATHLR